MLSRHDSSAIRARFVLTGFECPPAQISRLLGIEADAIGAAGEIRQRRDGSRYQTKDSYWELAARTQSLMVEDHVSELITLLEPCRSKLAKVPGKPFRKIDIALAISAHRSTPGINLTPSIMTRLAQLEVELDISLYTA